MINALAIIGGVGVSAIIVGAIGWGVIMAMAKANSDRG